ncbi:hypothetical protein JOL79_04730 [Microbispora sp. RL4-1S]|uniref:Uncharacterized protein n=1 Tax=Microbispora oryzae TaxID=2806554 RepID=A0A941AGK9_9ACTN|nr:hypothetical protein [Microbispora oryzae]MBP2703106.1 hypothetical protein [Microbispora oryzae]
MDDGAVVAGHRLTGRARTSEIGTWFDAVSPTGTPSAVLRFEQEALTSQRARDGLVAAVTADRRLWSSGLTGILPVADLVAARDEIYLIAGRRATPTLADLLAGHAALDPGGAATILVETAQTLLAVHGAGLSHGSLHPGTVVIGDDGSALLAERGLADALRGAPASAERDVAAWVALARVFTGGRAGGNAELLLERAAAAAAAHGLGAARDTLLAGRDALPPGFSTRERLARTVQAWDASAPLSPPGSPAFPPAGAPSGSLGGSLGGSLSGAPGEAVTLLDVTGHGAAGAVSPGGAVSPAGAGLGAGAAAVAPQGDEVMMRFGPGVPTETTAAQIWRSGRTASTLQGQPGTGKPARRRRGRTAWAGTVLLAMLIALVILWLRQSPPDEIAVSAVDVKGPKKTVRCDGTADFVGRVTTNGQAGTVRYVWHTSDGHARPEEEQRVASGSTTTDLPLHWNVNGPGSFKGTATLRVLSPTPSGKPMQDKASFAYKC